MIECSKHGMDNCPVCAVGGLGDGPVQVMRVNGTAEESQQARKEKIIADLRAGKSHHLLAKTYNLSPKRIYQIAKDNGLLSIPRQREPKGRPRKEPASGINRPMDNVAIFVQPSRLDDFWMKLSITEKADLISHYFSQESR